MVQAASERDQGIAHGKLINACDLDKIELVSLQSATELSIVRLVQEQTVSRSCDMLVRYKCKRKK